MSKITSYAAVTAPLTDCVVPIVDVHDLSQAATGTTKKVTLANLQKAIGNTTDTNIQPLGTQASGAVGTNADAGHVHPAGSWVPADNGLLAANFPNHSIAGTSILVAQNLQLMKIQIRQPFTATNLVVICSTIGAGASTQSFCGLWNSSGTLLTGSADIASNFTGSTGTKTLAFTTPQALTPSMGFVWAGIVTNLATTQPTLRCTGGATATNAVVGLNANLATAVLACCTNGTTVTALANITPSANSAGGNTAPVWCGIT